MPIEPNSESASKSGNTAANKLGAGESADARLHGVEHPGVIDLIGFDANRGEVMLRMVERRPWDGSFERLFQLQEKFNTYVAFAMDGEMNEAYPALVGRPVRIELRCVGEPDPKTADLLGKIGELIAFQGFQLDILVTSNI